MVNNSASILFVSQHILMLPAAQLWRRRQTLIDICCRRPRCDKPAAHRCCYRSTGQTDRQTDGQTDTVPLHRRSPLEVTGVDNKIIFIQKLQLQLHAIILAFRGRALHSFISPQNVLAKNKIKTAYISSKLVEMVERLLSSKKKFHITIPETQDCRFWHNRCQ